MVAIGQFNRLAVVSEVASGVYLDAAERGQILLPNRALPQGACQAGDFVEVFVHVDSAGRLQATTESPLATVGEFAWLKVVAVNDVGVFLDWGLPKDLLLPYSEQKYELTVGQRVMVRVFLDESTDRIAASARLDRFLQEQSFDFKPGQPVRLLIAEKTELGYKAIVDHSHWGLLYADESGEDLSIGRQLDGYIKRVREDKKIDLTLVEPGYGKVAGVAEQIIDVLKQHDGYLMITDKSSPETIRSIFKVSKKVYKKAVGALYKQRKIVIEDKGIRLLEN